MTLQRPGFIALCAGMTVMFAVLLGVGYLTQGAAVPQYLVWHNILEVIAIAIAALVFSVCWSSQAYTGERTYLWVGAGFLGVAILDFAHAMSFYGMPDYFTPNSVEKSIEFWLAARYLAAGVLLYAVLHLAPGRPAAPEPSARAWVLMLLLILVVVIHALVLTGPGHLPRTYIDGQGLTPFKVVAEAGVIALHLVTLSFLWRAWSGPSIFSRFWLALALIGLILSEVYFLLYLGPYDVFNLAGHIFKVIAYLCLYRAVFVEAVAAPYRALEVTNERLHSILEAIPDLLFDLDASGRVLDIHVGEGSRLRLPPQGLLGRPIADVISLEAGTRLRELLAHAATHGQAYAESVPIEVEDSVRHYELTLVRRGSVSDPATLSYLMLARDITDRVQNLSAMRQLQVAVEQSPSTVMITDLQSRLIYANRAFERSTGYTVAEAMGASPSLLHSGKTPRSTYDDLWRVLASGQAWRGEFINRRKDGSEYLESVLISPVADEQGITTSYLAIKEDITAQRRDQERIRQLSHFDRLTGLANRELLAERFGEVALQAKRQRRSLAVLSVGLDHFKRINESLGQAVGDKVLVETARRLQECLGAEPLLARYGGDEFIVITPVTTLKDATRWVDRIRDAVRAPIAFGRSPLIMTASVGIALWPDDGDSLDVLLQRANTAQGQAKSLGRDRHWFFSTDLQERAERILTLGNSLRSAIDEGQLHLVYQPQLQLADGKLVGAEVLLRWHHPQLGPVSPAEFIPVAESHGLIVPIGAWVLNAALQQARQWQERGLPPLAVAVNLSLRQVQDPDFLPMIDRALRASGVEPKWLELELTESMAMDDPEGFLEIVQGLQARGVRLAIDDFGTGYSSLSHLKRMRLQRLKIDKSFVDDVVHDDTARSIVQTIIGMAHSLGMSTTAEGVETAEQVVALTALACDEIQGYWLSKPLSADDLEAFVRGYQPSATT